MAVGFTMEKKTMHTICSVNMHTSITNIVINTATFKVYAYKMPDYSINKQLSYIHIHFFKENSVYLTIH